MSNQVTNARTTRGKARRMQADIDLHLYLASNRFNGNSTGRICASKLRGANHKKLWLEGRTKTYATYSNQ